MFSFYNCILTLWNSEHMSWPQRTKVCPYSCGTAQVAHPTTRNIMQNQRGGQEACVAPECRLRLLEMKRNEGLNLPVACMKWTNSLIHFLSSSWQLKAGASSKLLLGKHNARKVNTHLAVGNFPHQPARSAPNSSFYIKLKAEWNQSVLLYLTEMNIYSYVYIK